jgi:hypothetical protein
MFRRIPHVTAGPNLVTAGLDPAVHLPLSPHEVARTGDLRRDVPVAGDVRGLYDRIAALGPDLLNQHRQGFVKNSRRPRSPASPGMLARQLHRRLAVGGAIDR